jgi:hypothetical protein
VVVGFVVLVALGWNGSSDGAIRDRLEGDSPDPRRVFGEPNLLRSDEWFVITPYVVSQDNHDFPQVNPDAQGGTDVSVFSAVPYRDWSTVFRPQFWGFLVLPLDQGFAFCWWFPVLLLGLATYALVLGLCPNRPGLAAAAAGVMVASPFVQWWFLTITLASLGWATAVAASFVWLDRVAGSRRATVGLLALIAGATAALLMVLYPAFEIPCAWVAVAIAVGWTFRADAVGEMRARVHRLLTAGAAGAVGAALFGLFVLTRWDVVQTVADTEYPGRREVPTGGGHVSTLFTGFLGARLRSYVLLPEFLGDNASEASSFVFIGLFLAIPAVWLLVRARRHGLGIDGLLVALLGTLALFLGHLFVPGVDILAKLTLLSLVPVRRLDIGIGLLSLVLAVAVIREIERQSIRPPWWLVGLTGTVCLAALVRTGQVVEWSAPSWSGSVGDWLPLALAVTLIVVVAARGYGSMALACLAVFSAVATFRVHPVQDGVYDARDTAIGRTITRVDATAPGGWLAVGDAVTLAMLAEQPVLRVNGTALYPDFDDWTELDPDAEDHQIYNRYAHIMVTTNPNAPALATQRSEIVEVRLDACGAWVQNRVRHLVVEHQIPIDDGCLRLRETVSMPTATYDIYDVVRAPRRLNDGDRVVVGEAVDTNKRSVRCSS